MGGGQDQHKLLFVCGPCTNNTTTCQTTPQPRHSPANSSMQMKAVRFCNHITKHVLPAHNPLQDLNCIQQQLSVHVKYILPHCLQVGKGRALVSHISTLSRPMGGWTGGRCPLYCPYMMQDLQVDRGLQVSCVLSLHCPDLGGGHMGVGQHSIHLLKYRSLLPLSIRLKMQ